MLYLIDTADLDAIKKCSEYFPVSGVTTNPRLISAPCSTPSAKSSATTRCFMYRLPQPKRTKS